MNFDAWNEIALGILSVPLMMTSAVICVHSAGQFNFLWAVSAEFLCYIAFAMTAPYLRRWYIAATRPDATPLTLRSFWIGLPSICYLSTLIPNILLASTKGPASAYFHCNLLFTFWSRVPTFFLGAWSGYLALHIIHPAWQRASDLKKAQIGTIIDISLVCIGGLVLWGLRAIDDVVGTTLALMSHKETFAPLTVFVILVLSLDTGRVAKGLSWAPLLVLGEISYEVYILHAPVAGTFKFIYSNENYIFVCSLPITIAVSYVVQRYFSAPVFSWMTAAATKTAPRLSCKCSKQPMKPSASSDSVSFSDDSSLDDQHSSSTDEVGDTTRLINQV
jgi:peptidoglycan/LPS O-acetylase OafA/YrhL